MNLSATVRATPPVIAITSGEPAGIGPDLCVLMADQLTRETRCRFVLFGDALLLAVRARLRNLKWPPESTQMRIEHIPLTTQARPGYLDPTNSSYVLTLLDHALQACMSGRCCAMVTAPVHKGVINDAGIAFTGHTEYLAVHTQTPHVVMMLVGGTPPLRVALATTHLALSAVPAAISWENLEATLRILHHDLRTKFGFAAPRILVAGLNPHAGESGHLGHEEIEIIAPVIEKLKNEGMQLTGPLPADTLFTPRHLANADAVLAMYHDQGLTVLKYASFGTGVNVTLGLPIVRTSVDHGTALDLAGTGTIDSGSMQAAIDLAIDLALSNPNRLPH